MVVSRRLALDQRIDEHRPEQQQEQRAARESFDATGTPIASSVSFWAFSVAVLGFGVVGPPECCLIQPENKSKPAVDGS